MPFNYIIEIRNSLFHILVSLSALFICNSAIIADCADLKLDSLPEDIQLHENWCWDGTSQAILNYYGVNQSQCTIANWALTPQSGVDCCSNYPFYASSNPSVTELNCNLQLAIPSSPPSHASVQAILQNWGVNTYIPSPIGPETMVSCVTEINAGRPFIIVLDRDGGIDRHFVVAYGYEQDCNHIWYMDPWPGIGKKRDSYSNVKAIYFNGINSDAGYTSYWTFSLRSSTNPRPACETGFVSSVSSSTAKLGGTVNANNTTTTVNFEYGTTTSYGSTLVSDQGTIAGGSSATVSATISGLNPGTLYHFRVKATNVNGTSYSSDQTFTTAAATLTNGVCGTVNGQTLTYQPNTNLCSSGTASAVSSINSNSTPWSFTWTCNGSYGGSSQNCTAYLQTYQLTVYETGTGTGSVSSNIGPLNWNGSTGTATYASGTLVTLYFQPNPYNSFNGWSGVKCSLESPLGEYGLGCMFTMNANTTVYANFLPWETLTVSKLGTGNGTVDISTPGYSDYYCSSSCSSLSGCSVFSNNTPCLVNWFDQNNTLTLTAAPNPGNIFTGWSGACTGKGPCSVTMSSAQSVSATFVPNITPILMMLLSD